MYSLGIGILGYVVEYEIGAMNQVISGNHFDILMSFIGLILI